ncbi:site-specific integrase [Frigoribacterium sp. PhB118]|uniref:tyrosine-type recombinase/integrase n=1 Tax=Frigoribacterium sp. PhB118 TaxID=2485175 RepID=UPI000F46EE06|nr:site-specific integrase [Frigoribacterium sp. PhB118]ROS56582.1 phage integrase family protein [Frigoribacterium sp. PhB118]
MVDKLGGLAFLPVPDRGADRDAFFGEILKGWANSQAAKSFGPETIRRRANCVLRFADFAGKFPWEWTPQDADDFFSHLRNVLHRAPATARAYQSDIQLFLDYATSESYPWNAKCEHLFGTVMSQIITDLNKTKHVFDGVSGPEKRAFELDELQAFFDFADLEVQRIARAKRKGAMAAWRDAVAFKVCYGWGLRHDELRKLKVSDFSRSGKAPYFGDYGILRVRHGKAQKGSGKKQRSVLSLVDWAAEAVAEWVASGLPRMGVPDRYLFPTATGGLVSKGDLLARLHAYTSALDLPAGLDIHGLRRSYATHMITIEGYDEKFISMQLGHAHTSTTTIYTLPSADFAHKQLERVLTKTVLQSKGKLLLKPKRPSGRTTP